MNAFKPYRLKLIMEFRPYVPGEEFHDTVAISRDDIAAGHPKPGDMIGRNPNNHYDQFLLSAEAFVANFEPV